MKYFVLFCASAITAIGCGKKSSTPDAPSAAAANAPVVSVALSASSASQNQNACFAVTATAIGSGSTAVNANQAATFSLATSGAGAFYSDSGCSSGISSDVIGLGQSTHTIYYKSATIENVSLQATFNSTAGSAWNGTIYGPNPPTSQMANTVKNQSCIPVSFYFVTGGSVTAVTYDTDVTLTQINGNPVTFYTGAGCTSTVLTTGATTTFTVPAGNIGPTLYGSCGSAGQNFVFTSNWGYVQNGVTMAKSGTVFYQNW